jgi:hypothetical protein
VPRRIGFIAAVSLVVVALVATAATPAVTPASGRFLRVGTARVQVLPGGRLARVEITGTIGGVGVSVSLPGAVRIAHGSFAYSGRTIWVWAVPPPTELPGTGTVKGRFPTTKRLTLSYDMRRGGASLKKSNVTLPAA